MMLDLIELLTTVALLDFALGSRILHIPMMILKKAQSYKHLFAECMFAPSKAKHKLKVTFIQSYLLEDFGIYLEFMSIKLDT